MIKNCSFLSVRSDVVTVDGIERSDVDNFFLWVRQSINLSVSAPVSNQVVRSAVMELSVTRLI